MNKILLMGLEFVILTINFTSHPLLTSNRIDDPPPTHGAHFEDPTMGYQLDIPANWYFIVPPASDDSIAKFNSDFLEYYNNKNCKYTFSPNDLKVVNESRLWFMSFNESRNCSEVIPTGLIIAYPGSFYEKISISSIVKTVQEIVPPEIINATIRKTDNGIIVGIIQIEPTDEEDQQACPECIARFYLFTTEKGLIVVFISAQKSDLVNIEPDIERIISSIKYYDLGN